MSDSKLTAPQPIEDVRYCPVCRTKTWHIDGRCEWADGHAKMQETRNVKDA